MSEVLAQTDRSIWSDPTKISFLRAVIGNAVSQSRLISRDASYDPNNEVRVERFWQTLNHRDVGQLMAHDGKKIHYDEALDGINNRIEKLTERLKDRYLQGGVWWLSHPDTWNAVGNYLLTPERDREPIDYILGMDIQEASGSLCLAARFSGQYIMASFNGLTIGATPETLPAEVCEDFYSAVQQQRQ